jgi:GntR family transcriptional regulator, vanillate catabolism transcriptional regulator
MASGTALLHATACRCWNESKKLVHSRRKIRGIQPLIQRVEEDFNMPNKSDLRAVSPSTRPRPSDVASQTARAFFSLRESLIRGEFTPGERMAELPLVARVGVSRTPIRLALERLAHMGLLDISASGGFTVRSYTATEALDAIEIRGVLEGTAARLAAERLIDVAEVDALRALGEKMDRIDRLTLDSFGRYMDLNEAFHAAIIDLAKSAMLTRAIQHAVSLPFASPSAMVFPTSGLAQADDALALAKEHHRGIVDAISRRQGTRAEYLAREHAFIGRRVLTLALSDGETLSRIPGASLINPPTSPRTRS